jgi:hypothetical protein
MPRSFPIGKFRHLRLRFTSLQAQKLVPNCSVNADTVSIENQRFAMTHIAIQEALDGKVVDWLEKVSDEEYHAAATRRPRRAMPSERAASRMKIRELVSSDIAAPDHQRECCKGSTRRQSDDARLHSALAANASHDRSLRSGAVRAFAPRARGCGKVYASLSS